MISPNVQRVSPCVGILFRVVECEDIGKNILEMEPSRQFAFDDKEYIQEVWQGFNVSQSEFAQFMGVIANTLQNWEHGRRHPTGPARVLLRIVARKPEIFTEMRREESSEFAMA